MFKANWSEFQSNKSDRFKLDEIVGFISNGIVGKQDRRDGKKWGKDREIKSFECKGQQARVYTIVYIKTWKYEKNKPFEKQYKINHI